LEHSRDTTLWWFEGYTTRWLILKGIGKLLGASILNDPIFNFFDKYVPTTGIPQIRIYTGKDPNSLGVSWATWVDSGQKLYYGITVELASGDMKDHIDFCIDYGSFDPWTGWENQVHREFRPYDSDYFVSGNVYGIYPSESLVFLETGRYRIRAEGLGWPFDATTIVYVGDGSLAVVNSGNIVTLRENQEHLYTHVYDSLNRHVGLNYSSNQFEVGIPDAFYGYFGKTQVIVLPTNVFNFRILVDAKYAKEQTETYNLTVSAINNGQTVDEKTVQSSISRETVK